MPWVCGRCGKLGRMQKQESQSDQTDLDVHVHVMLLQHLLLLGPRCHVEVAARLVRLQPPRSLVCHGSERVA